MGFITAENICFEYEKGKPVIQNMSASLKQGIFTAITGPNGSGKSTFGKLAVGILKPSSGTVYIDGTETTKMSLGQAGEKTGYLFQNPERQIFTLNVTEELSFILRLRGASEDMTKEEVELLLDIFHLGNLKDASTFELSRGEKQRLAIASVLINKPDYLVLDEPTTGLDWLRKKILSGILKKLLSKGTGMAIITHDIEFAEKLADEEIKISGKGVWN